jgi:hypothetical protein
VSQLLLSTVFPPVPGPTSPLPAGEYSRRCFTVSIGLPSVDGAGVLRPSPKNAMRSFLMTHIGFLGKTCSRLLGCSFLIGVSVMKSLFLATLPSSIVRLLILQFLVSVHFFPGDIVRFRYDFVAVAVVVGRTFWNIASLPSNSCEV